MTRSLPLKMVSAFLSEFGKSSHAWCLLSAQIAAKERLGP
jgi:hypothetical protein